MAGYYGSDSRQSGSGIAVITDIKDEKGKNGGKGDMAGFYQIRVLSNQDNIEKDKLIYVPDMQSGAAHQKMGQFLPRELGSIVEVNFDDAHMMSGHIVGGYGTAGNGTSKTVDGSQGVERDTNSYPQYARGDIKQPVSIGLSKSETEPNRKDSASYYKDIDTLRKKTIPKGKRMTAAYPSTLSADQSYA